MSNQDQSNQESQEQEIPSQDPAVEATEAPELSKSLSDTASKVAEVLKDVAPVVLSSPVVLSAQEKYKNTKEMLHLIILLPNIYAQAKADGKIDANDLPLLLQLLPAFGPAIDDITLIPKEFEGFQANDGYELISFVMSEFKVGDDHAREIIQEALATAVQLVKLYKVVKK